MTDEEHDTRAELAATLAAHRGRADRGRSCSQPSGRRVRRRSAHRRRSRRLRAFAALVDAAFRTLCAVSHSMGAQPLTPAHVAATRDDRALRAGAARPLPVAVERMAAIGAERRARGTARRVRHPAIAGGAGRTRCSSTTSGSRQQKPPNGKRPWFEPLRHGWVVRGPYGTGRAAASSATWFVHPVRVAALRRFLEDTTP